MFQSLFSPDLIFRLIAVPLSLVIHEYAHARVADWFGDKTPRMNGRLTLNPLAHLELLGLIMMLFGPFGWARPVPMNPNNFKRRKLGWFCSVAAGPISNLLLAIVFVLILKALFTYDVYALSSAFIVNLLYQFVLVNVVLFIFNLIPLYPLDGYQLVKSFVPYRYAGGLAKYEMYSPFILLLLVILPPCQTYILTPLFTWILGAFGSLFGFI